MRKNKHFTTIVCLALGVVMLTTAAFANYSNANGYNAYKQSLLNLLKTDNYTLELDASVKVDGVEITSSSNVYMVDIAGEVTAYTKSSGVDTSGENGSEEWTVYAPGRGKEFSDYKTYHRRVNDWSDRWTINSSYNNGAYLSPISDIQREIGEGEQASKILRIAELAADMLVGDLKNNFVYTGKSDLGKSYQITVAKSQLPEIVTAVMDLAFDEALGLNNRYHEVSALSSEIADSYVPQPIAMPSTMPSPISEELPIAISVPDGSVWQEIPYDEKADIDVIYGDDADIFEMVQVDRAAGLTDEEIYAAHPGYGIELLDEYIAKADSILSGEYEWDVRTETVNDEVLAARALAESIVGIDFDKASCFVTIDDNGNLAANTLQADLVFKTDDGNFHTINVTVDVKLSDIGNTVIDMPAIPENATVYDYSIGSHSNGYIYTVTKNGITVEQSQEKDGRLSDYNWFSNLDNDGRIAHTVNFTGLGQSMNYFFADDAYMMVDGEVVDVDDIAGEVEISFYGCGEEIVTLTMNVDDPISIYSAFRDYLSGVYAQRAEFIKLADSMDVTADWLIGRLAGDIASYLFEEQYAEKVSVNDNWAITGTGSDAGYGYFIVSSIEGEISEGQTITVNLAPEILETP